MSGYTPLFSSLTTGTLCGKWPDIGLWPIILSMADKHGVVDVTTAYISSVTGLPHDEVVACMLRFCEPDKYSRSAEEAGARLVLVDPNRPWGWRIVNHTKYREKARKQAFDAHRVASGQNRERMSGRSQTRDDPRSPATTHNDPPSDSDANTNSKKDAALDTELREVKAIYPKRSGNNPWPKARKALAVRLREGHSLQEILDGVRRYANFCQQTQKVDTEFVMQAPRFLGPDKPFLEPWDIPAKRNASGETPEERKRRIYGNAQ